MTAYRSLRDYLHLADLAITDALHGEVTYSRRATPHALAGYGLTGGASPGAVGQGQDPSP